MAIPPGSPPAHLIARTPEHVPPAPRAASSFRASIQDNNGGGSTVQNLSDLFNQAALADPRFLPIDNLHLDN